MKPNAIKSVLAAAVCLASMHSQAQNVSKLAIELQGQKQQMWSVGKLNQVNPEIKTQEIYNRTLDFLKSPNRVQKMGGMDGGGGNALLCNENGKVTAELLDVYEARSLGVQFELGGKNSMLEILDHVFNRLSNVSPFRATVYSTMARDLLSKDTQWVSNKQMPVIDDVNITLIPQDCLLVQVAIQRPIDQQNLPNAKTYIIDSEMFNLLDETSKAALVLHEVLYREARHSVVNDSIFTRQLTGLIMSQGILKYNVQTLNNLYTNNKVKCVESLDTPTFEVQGSLRQDFYCDFIRNLNFKSSFSKTIDIKNDVENYKLQETWTGQVLYRRSGFSVNIIEDRIKSYSRSGQDSSYSVNNFYQTKIDFNGTISFNAKFEDSNVVQLMPIQVDRGQIISSFASDYFQNRNLDADKVSSYTSSNLNYFTKNSHSKGQDQAKEFTDSRLIKLLIGKKITFSSKNIRLADRECEFHDEQQNFCTDFVQIGIDLKSKSFLISSFKNIQIYHPSASKYGVSREYLKPDGWVNNVDQVRLKPDGNISEYRMTIETKPTWIKYQ